MAMYPLQWEDGGDGFAFLLIFARYVLGKANRQLSRRLGPLQGGLHLFFGVPALGNLVLLLFHLFRRGFHIGDEPNLHTGVRQHRDFQG